QTSQEELKSTNEELQSTNEELQSTNEELTTSKEEMQSLNEELQTVNIELQSKVSDFVQANNDMKNLLNSTEVATLFLDKELNIRRFTEAVTNIIKLRNSDIGRPFTDQVSNLKYPEIENHSRQVIRTLSTIETAISSSDGRWFNIRIMPYRTLDDRIDGLVITFADITIGKRAEEALQASETRFRTLFENAPMAINVSRNRIGLYANHKFVEMFGLKNAGEAVGRFLESYYPPQCIADMRERAGLSYPEGQKPTEFTTIGLRSDGTQFPMAVVASEILLPDGKAVIAFVTDISRQVEDAGVGN
ncbi:MAG: PAS domain-containing protein, partial [Bacteroidota bacterium]